MLAMQQVLLLVLYVAIGIFVQKRKMVKPDFDGQLNKFYSDIILPCMIFNSLQLAFDPSDLKNCAILLVLAVCYFLISATIGQICYQFIHGDMGRITRFGMIFTNFTLMGFPLVEELFGAHTLFYFTVFLLPLRMVFYSGAKAMLTPPDLEHPKATIKEKLKHYFSPPVVAVFIGLIFYFFQWKLPTVIGNVVSGLGGTASVLGMVTCGMMLGKQPLTKLLRPRYLLVSVLRLLLVPCIYFLLLTPLPFDPEIRQVIVMCASPPVASLTASFTLRYNKSPDAQFDAAGAVLVSHIFCVLTIPIWANLLA